MTPTPRIEDRKLYRRAAELPADAKTFIVKMLTVQLQSEYADAPDRSGSICPTVEDKSWLDFQIAQEKAHGLGVARILEDMGVDPGPLIAQAETSVMEGDRKLDYFKIRMEDWIERSMTRVLAERTGGIQSIGGLGASYIPLAVWNAKNYVDEALGHTAQGVNYARQLVAQGSSAECQKAVDKFYPSCLDIFGGVGTPNEKRYQELGIKTLTNNQSRALWIRSLERDLEALDLKMPAGRWQGIRSAYPAEEVDSFSVFLEIDDLPADRRKLAVRLLSGWLSAKYARQHAMAVFIAPTPRLKHEVALQMSADREAGLAIAKMLRKLDVDPNPIADEAERTLEGGRYKVDFLKQPLPGTWEAIAVQQLVAARAAQAASLASFGSAVVPLAVWAGVHYDTQERTAGDWLQRLREAPEWAVHSQGQQALDLCFGRALDVFGADGSTHEAAYFKAGLKTASNAEVRRVFVEMMAEDLASIGLRLPDCSRNTRNSYAVAGDRALAEAA
jgi:1,2-phenylacetyl-CoA epoxidase catalytic subunit